jgi:hypothetical protein
MSENSKQVEYFNPLTNNDRWVVDLFEGTRYGFFVEAGALDGLTGSCTLTLERHFGWKGILVEPGLAFPALVVNRPGCICENVCLAGSSGIVLFVDASDSGYSGIKEKLILDERAHAERWGKSRDQWHSPGCKERDVVAMTLFELLRKHAAPRVIEYAALDIEGSEYEVLKEFPFEEYAIMALSIEGDACSKLLLARGYKEVANNFNTEAPWEHYFVHQDFQEWKRAKSRQG